MDRSKGPGGSGRGSKKVTPSHTAGEFFALGSKGYRDEQMTKSKFSQLGKGSLGASGERKRDASSSGVMSSVGGVGSSTSSLLAVKKSKLSASASGSMQRTTMHMDCSLLPSGSGIVDRQGGSSVTTSGASITGSYLQQQQQQQLMQQEIWEQMSIECEPYNLVDSIFTASEQFDIDTVVRLICGALKGMISTYGNKCKPDPIVYMSLLYVAKLYPDYMSNDVITSALLHILRRDVNCKVRQNPLMHSLAANLLARAFEDKKQWPEIFLRVYIDDAINERYWADNVQCAPFIENIATAFKTQIPQLNFMPNEYGIVMNTNSVIGNNNQQTSNNPSSSAAITQTVSIDDDSCDNSETSNSLKQNILSTGIVTTTATAVTIDNNQYYNIKERYINDEQVVEKYVTDAIKEQLNKRQQQESYTRNFLKFLCKTSGLHEVRYLCITRLELWLHNGKLVKFAQELLSYICFNVRAHNYKDHEVLAILVKMRLKAKPLINFFMSCIKEMILLERNILIVILKFVVQNELSNTRNPNNMGMLATMFQTLPDDSAKHLAEIYKEFLLQRDDCIRTLRVFLRELVRMLRNDINLEVFCKVLLNSRPDLNEQIINSEYYERIYNAMVDITCLSMLLSVSPQVREASSSLRAANKESNSSANSIQSSNQNNSNAILLRFYNQMRQMQLDAVTWMYEIVPGLFKLGNNEFKQGLQKILLLESHEQYSRHDQWPSEPERSTLLRLVTETPIHEDTLFRIILIGITKEIPYNVPDTFDIILLILKRASSMRLSCNCPVVEASKLEIIDFVFSMSEYHHPENINLPTDYEPPKLAITVLYWKAWLILLIISAHNPSTFGAFCWSHYPTMKVIMEMCITNQFSETPPTKDEIQISRIERDTIIEFETYLAAQTSQTVITEENAILTSQLMLMNPMGVPRRVPVGVLEQLHFLNKTFKIGHLLCRSRKPDLLLDIIQRQGTTQSMPWLSDLVQDSDGDFDLLPVQCLCEFLLFNSTSTTLSTITACLSNMSDMESTTSSGNISVNNNPNNNSNNYNQSHNSRHAELVTYLRNIIMDPNYDKQTVCDMCDYIFRRLCSMMKESRLAALRGLKIIFNSITTGLTEQMSNEWLLNAIPQIPHFQDVRIFIIPHLRSACQVENSPDLVMAYIQFIAAHTINDNVQDMLDHVIDMAQLIVERSTMFQHIIPIPIDEDAVAKTSNDSEDMQIDVDDDKVIESKSSESSTNNVNNNVKLSTAEQENRLQTLKCLFVMFNNYIIKLRDHNDMYEWTEYPDLLMVQFNDGVQLPLHLNIIHAFIILLTQSNKKMPESIPILDYWFPLEQNVPIAFLPNMPHEPIQILPDWLKLKMIRSSVDRLIEAAIRDLTPDQIVLFVQNFGTPINSMSKLLALLDHAVIDQFDIVKNAILNKAYLAQLIEIQQARGAKNGHLTVQALDLDSHSQTVDDYPNINTSILRSMNESASDVEILDSQNTNNQNTSDQHNQDILNQGCPTEDIQIQDGMNQDIEIQDDVNQDVQIQDGMNQVVQVQDGVNRHVLMQDDVNQDIKVQDCVNQDVQMTDGDNQDNQNQDSNSEQKTIDSQKDNEEKLPELKYLNLEEIESFLQILDELLKRHANSMNLDEIVGRIEILIRNVWLPKQIMALLHILRESLTRKNNEELYKLYLQFLKFAYNESREVKSNGKEIIDIYKYNGDRKCTYRKALKVQMEDSKKNIFEEDKCIGSDNNLTIKKEPEQNLALFFSVKDNDNKDSTNEVIKYVGKLEMANMLRREFNKQSVENNQDESDFEENIEKKLANKNVCLREKFQETEDKEDKCRKDKLKIAQIGGNGYDNVGNVVDLLSETDPELCSLFRENEDGGSKYVYSLFSKKCGSFRYYILSWICHATNWETIMKTFDCLLETDRTDLDYTAALNFIQALMNHPKLWQGRDKSISKCDKEEILFLLNDHELQTFIQFILKETQSISTYNLYKKISGNNTNRSVQRLKNRSNRNETNFKLYCRINLLYSLIQKNSKYMLKCMDCVENPEWKVPRSIRLKVIRQMYNMYPPLKFIHYRFVNDFTERVQKLIGCQADRITNNLITCLGNLYTKKDYDLFSSDTEVLLRKLAASHPTLFLRQLGLLTSLIQGRGKLSLHALRDDYHMHRFIQILRLFELLQPMCFQNVYRKEFQDALDCYFTFFRQFRNIKELYNMLLKFVDLLRMYVQVNPDSALPYLRQYDEMLATLSIRHSNLNSLHQLLLCIRVMQQKSSIVNNSSVIAISNTGLNKTSIVTRESTISALAPLETLLEDTQAELGDGYDSTDSCNDDDVDGELEISIERISSSSSSISAKITTSLGITAPYTTSTLPTITPMSMHFAYLINIVKNSSNEDIILGPLQEIECMTSKRYPFLSELFDRLLELIFSHNAQIRSNAFILLIRHLKQDPGRKDLNRLALNAYLQCLRDDNSSVAATAVDHLPDMTLLLQEHATEILSVSFALGIRSRLNTSTQIKRVLQTIMLQQGY